MYTQDRTQTQSDDPFSSSLIRSKHTRPFCVFFFVQYLTGGLAQVCSIYPAHLTRVPLWPIVHLVLQVYLICLSKLSLSHISFFTRSNCEGMSDECQNGHTKWAQIGDPTTSENFANYGLHLSQQMICILQTDTNQGSNTEDLAVCWRLKSNVTNPHKPNQPKVFKDALSHLPSTVVHGQKTKIL